MPVRGQEYEFVTKWGTRGTGDGQFQRPYRVAIDSLGNIYVLEDVNSRIQKFTSEGVFLTKWGTWGSGDGQFMSPYGIAIDSSDNVYVADLYNHRIQKFTSEGVFLTKWGTKGSGDGQFIYPMDVAVDSSDNVYVADGRNYRIQKFTSEGVFLTKWGTEGSGDGEFNMPCGITVDSSGNVYVADPFNCRIQKFTSDGVFLTKWGTQFPGDSGTTGPWGLATDTSGNIFVADINLDRILKFTSEGVFLTKWGTKGWNDGQFKAPVGVVVNDYGSVYVADKYNYRIQVFAPDNSPPVADAGADQTLEATSPDGAEVTMDGTSSNDPDGDPLTYTWTDEAGETIATGPTPTVTLSVGEHTITLIVDDGNGGTDSDEVVIEVVDTTPPEISVLVEPDELWPPNHKMKTITATVTVTDICDSSPSVALTSIVSNEPDEGLGDGDKPNDIQDAEIGEEDYEFSLRAERSGGGDGRIYTITYTATDASGNSQSASATVTVPHDKGKGKAAPGLLAFSALSAYPQPCNPEAWIPYTLAKDVEVTITIYNSSGHIIRTLQLGNQDAGTYISRGKAAYWDGKNDIGETVSSGVYFYRLKAGDFIATKKLVVLR